MLVTMDKVGRVVIPKEVRERLSLEADSELEITVDGVEVRLTPVRQPGRRIAEVDGWLALEAVPGLSITDADVRSWRDDVQR